MSQQKPHDQPQVQPPTDITQRTVDPHRLVKSRLHEDSTRFDNSHLKESIKKIGVLLPVLVRKEDGQWAVFDGWERVLKARDAGKQVPVWLPDNGHWSDKKVLRARLFANTTANQDQLNWLRRAWLFEDAWDKVGDTAKVSPSGIAELVNIPEPTARHWIEPTREQWNNTLIDRDFYENGQIREEHGSVEYIIGGLEVEKVVKNLGTRTLIDIRTRSKMKKEIQQLLVEFVSGSVQSTEFERAKELEDTSDKSLLDALKEVREDRDTTVDTTITGDTASQITHVSSQMGMDETEFIQEATEQYLEQANIDGKIDQDEMDSGHLRQQSYLDQQVQKPRPQPSLRMESNENMNELPANAIHLSVTSPPYNVAWDYGSEQNDNRRYYQEYLGELIADTFREVYRLTCEGGYCCIVIPLIYDIADETVDTPEGTPIAADIAKVLTGEWRPTNHDTFERLQKETDWRMNSMVIWYKGFHKAGLRDQDWVSDDMPLLKPELSLNNFLEAILVLKKPGQRDVSSQRTQQSGIVWQKSIHDRDLRENLWRISPESWEPSYADKADTPQFPEELAKRCILHWSYVGDTVLDPFCGRGTTLKMAKQLYRESIGYEIQEELERDIREYVGM